MKITSKLFLILLAIISLGLVQIAFGEGDKEGKGPELFVENSVFIFKPVVDGTIVNHEFDLMNKGSGELKITKVKTG